MKETIEYNIGWREILTQIGVGAAFGTAFLFFVCCGDAFCRMLGGQ